MGGSWPAGLAATAGREVARLRREQGMSAQVLADRCAAIGVPILRGAIAKLENGRRESLQVHEVLALAYALRVPPLHLLFPEDDAQVEYLPGLTWSGTDSRVEFVGSRAPHVEALTEALTLIRYATARVEAVIGASTEGE